jgi:hypothetical protein
VHKASAAAPCVALWSERWLRSVDRGVAMRVEQSGRRELSGAEVMKAKRGNSSPACTLYSRARQWTESGTAVKPGVAISGGGRCWNGVGTVWAPTSGQ